ncbi:NLI-interacting factor, putative [Bodo saltans]|uniref:Mitochondrial import inner membrane translocase subunit TIM50 n=1 Tax=Bodo saltans TaxID=75058 RepID=A0A0S4JFL1_BODSA|nr:NLI-interacting factor, putative [Bodo saltans]|eukprot:CUG87939.1 NLI-interacting factor, putative [Bodo saltans]
MRVTFLKLCTVPARNDWHRVHWPVPLPPMLHTIGPASKQPQTTKGNAAKSKKPQAAKKKKHTLVLDIDDTLLNHVGDLHHENKRLTTYQVSLRPHVGAFLKEMHELFEVVMYTAAVTCYGGAMTNLLEKAAGLPPSPYYDATVPWGCFESRDQASVEEAKAMKYAPVLGKDHVNWYLLTRSQTLNGSSFDRMKHLPILGRDPNSTIIIDDNVRSFPLNPRAGIKIAGIRGKDDDALLKLSPMLRAVAAAPSALRELDHWRADEYVKCDKFTENMDYSSDVRSRILGTVLYERRKCAIPKLVADSGNAKLLEEAKKKTEELFEKSKNDVKDQKAKATAFAKA